MSIKIHPSLLKLAEQAYRRHHIIVPEGVPFADLLKRETWSHVGEKLRPLDRIDVLAEDGAYVAELLVMNCERLWADVRQISYVELGEASAALPAESPEYEVVWGGPVKKHGVRRVSDKAWMHEGCASKEEAALWLKGHLQALAR